MNRREFLTWVGVGSVASSLPIALAAYTPTAVAQGVKVASLDELDAADYVGIREPEKVIVIKDPNDPTQLLARTANCNHRNCTVIWNKDAKQFRCPCHNSRFAVDGSIIRGPATQPLNPVEVYVEERSIFVSL
jgi:cytochrome b6-f complex iron-sulfur subunit